MSIQNVANNENITQDDIPEEGSGLVTLNIKIPEDLHTDAKSCAAQRRLKLREFAILALRRAVSEPS